MTVFRIETFMRKVLKLLTTLISLTSSDLSAVPRIDWLAYSLQPYHGIKDTNHRGKGIGEVILQIWKKNLRDYNHHTQEVNIPRMVHLLSSPEFKGCVVGSFIGPSFKNNLLWSKIVFVEMPPMIVINRESWSKLGRPVSISAKTLISKKELRFGRVRHRVFGSPLDNIIEKAHLQRNLVKISSIKPTESLVKMVTKRRLDWGIIFPAELGWVTRGMEKRAFITVAIKEHSGGIPVHAGCSKTKQGEKVIGKINKALDNRENLESIRESFEYWLPDANSKSLFRKLNSF